MIENWVSEVIFFFYYRAISQTENISNLEYSSFFHHNATSYTKNFYEYRGFNSESIYGKGKDIKNFCRWLLCDNVTFKPSSPPPSLAWFHCLDTSFCLASWMFFIFSSSLFCFSSIIFSQTSRKLVWFPYSLLWCSLWNIHPILWEFSPIQYYLFLHFHLEWVEFLIFFFSLSIYALILSYRENIIFLFFNT